MLRLLFPSLLVWLCCSLSAPAENSFLTLSNEPLGTEEKPLILRTYFPDPGLSPEVLQNHDVGYRARKYKPGLGDVEGFDDPIEGIPAAIGVNFGPTLSYCWDTTECRLLYAWQGGFLDMTNYWGEPESGRRKKFGYVPDIAGSLIYLARGSHPLGIYDNFAMALAPIYQGYQLEEGVPVFTYSVGEVVISVKITPGDQPMSILKEYRIEGSAEGYEYKEIDYQTKIEKDESGAGFTVIIEGRPGMQREKLDDTPKFTTDKPNTAWGEALYTQLGCFACHSTDGTRGHGPTFTNLYGAARQITGMADPIPADDAYLRESIVNPVAKVVDGFPPGYMPPYPLEDDMLTSLVLYIQTLKDE